jgi:serine/threonine protein kinase
MELVDGADLKHRLVEGPLTPTQVCWLGSDLADGLDRMHRAGFLHRDVKPANVLLFPDERGGRVRGKLSDFGIASIIGRAENAEFTSGTAAYLSPEQVEGGLLGGASDVYSLGLVLIQAATGRVSFPGSVLESAFARLSRDPEIPGSLPPRLAAVLAGMTRKSIGDRIPLEQARAEFERALAEQIATGVLPPARLVETVPAPRASIAVTPPDREFGRITGIAARLLKAPAAFVVLGDPGEEASAFVPEAHREELAALALRALQVDRIDGWTVEDVRSDPRTAGAVRAAPVRSMAVQPILDGFGERVGVLAVLDALPRDFGVEETATLADLAGLVGHEVDLRRAVRRALFAREP